MKHDNFNSTKYTYTYKRMTATFQKLPKQITPIIQAKHARKTTITTE